MRRFSISEFSTHRWSLDTEVEEYSKRNIHGIGIWRSKFTDFDSDVSTDLLYFNSMRVSSLSWAGGFTGSCGTSHEDAIFDAKSAIRTAARIGAECLIVHPGSRDGHTRRHAYRLLKSALDRLIPVAADYGVRLALEIMQTQTASAWTIFDSFEETVELACTYSKQHVGLVLDLFHVGGEMTLLHAVKDLVPRLALVQLADRVQVEESAYHRYLMGCGEIPVQTWFDELENAGYEGFYELELHGPGMEAIPYRQRLDQAITAWHHLRNRTYSKLDKPVENLKSEI